MKIRNLIIQFAAIAVIAGCASPDGGTSPVTSVTGHDGRTYYLESRREGYSGVTLTVEEVWRVRGDSAAYFRKLEPQSAAPPIFLRYR